MSANKVVVPSSLLILILSTFSCAHSIRDKVLQNMLLAGATGFALGQQKAEYKNTMSIMYFGLGASLAAAGTIFLENPDDLLEKEIKEKEKFKNQLEESLKPKIESSNTGMMNSKIPAKYQKLISPGEWKIYSLDQWMEEGENRLIHQDKLMELIPPTLIPKNLPQITNKGKEEE